MDRELFNKNESAVTISAARLALGTGSRSKLFVNAFKPQRSL